MRFSSRQRLMTAAIATVLFCSAGAPATHAAEPIRELLLSPDIFVTEKGSRMHAERGLILVPENRRDPNSRLIAVHFVRARALEDGGSARPPLFLLFGGPGSEAIFTQHEDFEELERLRKSRDVIYVSQRGNPRAPGLAPALNLHSADRPLDRPTSVAEESASLAKRYGAALDEWRGLGLDVTGYDIENISADLNDIRLALGYEKIALRGCSFGSQWSFAYMARWPETVDRALLSGVEPLDFTYDSATWLVASIARVAEAAEASDALAGAIPEGGLMAAFRAVLARLDAAPVSTTVTNPETGSTVEVVLGGDDLRMLFRDTLWSLGGNSETANLSRLPKFILELYRGDYRMLGAMALEERRGGEVQPLISSLIDNSIGMSSEREAALLAEPERAVLDPNWRYWATRGVSAAPVQSQAFREKWPTGVPILLVSGDYDWSTPIENAEVAAKALPMAHLMIVGGATHCPLNKEEQLPSQRPDVMNTIYGFLDADFSEVPAEKWFERLPDRVDLAPVRFEPMNTPALYEQVDGVGGN